MRKFCILLGLTVAVLCAAPVAMAQQAHDPAFQINDEQVLHPPNLEPPTNYAYTDGRLTALAEPDGQVDIDIGDTLAAVLAAFGTAIAAWVAAIISRVAGNWLEQKDAARLAEYTKRAVEAAANYVPGALKGKKVSFKVGSEWVERALEQGLALFPDLINAFGGEAAQRRRLWAHMELEENEAVPSVSPLELKPVKATTSPATLAEPKPAP